MRIAILLVVIAGCSSLEPIDRGRCGNGVIEDGEDCDSNDGRCVACGLRCDDAGGCDGFAGAVCGADQFCHAPAGTFHAAGQLALSAASYRVNDIDHDGFGDLVVQAQTAVTVLPGNLDGALIPAVSVLTPIAQGPASYVDIDGDRSLDLLMPTADGLVAYTSPFGVPVPFPFPSPVAQMGSPQFVHVIDPQHIGIIATDPAGVFSYLIVDIGPAGGPPGASAPLCGATAAEFTVGNVDQVPVAPGHTMLAVALGVGTLQARLCVLAVDRQVDGTLVMRNVTPAAAIGPTGPPVLAPLRPPCPSLVLRTAGGLFELPPTGVPGSCGFTGPQPLVGATSEATPVGFLPLSPALGASDRALVMSDGIYAFDGGLTKVYTADRTLSQSRFADVDKDGQIDLIASSAAANDLDIVFRRDAGFLRFRLATTAPVLSFLLGDFDGNEHVDIAYIQKLAQAEELAVSYGTSDQVLPGALTGRFRHVRSVIPVGLPDSNDPANIVTDLAVVGDSNLGPQLSLLHGSPQRAMLAFFDPRPPNDPQSPTQRSSVFGGVVAGNFIDTPGGVDLLGFENVDVTTQAAIKHETALWLSDGARGGQTAGTVPLTAAELVRCDGSQDADTFCENTARYVAWPVAPERDFVLGIDDQGHGTIGDPRAVEPDGAGGMRIPFQRWPDVIGVPAGDRVGGAHVLFGIDAVPAVFVQLHDVDGRGSGVLACDVDRATGLASACHGFEDVVAVARPEQPWTCVDAQVARVAPATRLAPPATTTPELLVLCRGTARAAVFRITDHAEVLVEVDAGDELQVGDLNGDGVDDLVVLDRQTAVPTLRVLVQCTSRNTEACR